MNSSVVVSEDLIFEKLKKQLSKNFKISENDITKDKHIINDFGLDSIDLIELIMDFETEFNTSVPDSIIITDQISPKIGEMITNLREFLIYGKILSIKEKRKLKLEEIKTRNL